MAKYKRVVIFGVGLLGGSIGLALRARQLADEVVGCGRSLQSLQEALALKAVDACETDLTTACSGADLAIVCTPVQLVAEFVRACQKAMPPGGLITDVGSTKLGICSALADSASHVFCGAHPLAGSDKSGVTFAAADLFDGKLTVITPTPATPEQLTQRTEIFWQSLGSRTVRMDALEHDCGVACTSHLPHIVAAALAAGTPESLLPLAASGWCDTTRVAAGGTELWRQILLENRGPVLQALEQYVGSLGEWLAALRRADGKQLEQLLEAGKQKRDTVGN